MQLQCSGFSPKGTWLKVEIHTGRIRVDVGSLGVVVVGAAFSMSLDVTQRWSIEIRYNKATFVGLGEKDV